MHYWCCLRQDKDNFTMVSVEIRIRCTRAQLTVATLGSVHFERYDLCSITSAIRFMALQSGANGAADVHLVAQRERGAKDPRGPLAVIGRQHRPTHSAPARVLK